MRTTQAANVTPPDETAKAVKAGARTGEYAGSARQYPSQSETIEDGLRLSITPDHAMENWLRDQVGPACDALRADPSRAIMVDRVRARLVAEHARVR